MVPQLREQATCSARSSRSWTIVPACGEDFSHQRADDFPAYLVIVVVGHISCRRCSPSRSLMRLPNWLQYLIWLPLTLFSGTRADAADQGRGGRPAMAAGNDGFAAAKQRRLGRISKGGSTQKHRRVRDDPLRAPPIAGHPSNKKRVP